MRITGRIFFVFSRSPLVVLGIWAALIIGCSEKEQPAILPSSQQLAHDLEASNRRLNAIEEEAIEDLIARYGWNMQQTGSGLRMMIENVGSSPAISYGNRVVLEYEVFLLTGDLVYSSQNDGPMEFEVGRGGVESGLEEGILYLGKGGSAHFILPSYLAHGLPGDGVGIPRRASIVYKIIVSDIW